MSDGLSRSTLQRMGGFVDPVWTVREAMLSGYRSTAPRLGDATPTRWPLYEPLASVRVMNDVERLAPRLPDGTADDVADGIEMDVASILDDG